MTLTRLFTLVRAKAAGFAPQKNSVWHGAGLERVWPRLQFNLNHKRIMPDFETKEEIERRMDDLAREYRRTPPEDQRRSEIFKELTPAV